MSFLQRISWQARDDGEEGVHSASAGGAAPATSAKACAANAFFSLLDPRDSRLASSHDSQAAISAIPSQSSTELGGASTASAPASSVCVSDGADPRSKSLQLLISPWYTRVRVIGIAREVAMEGGKGGLGAHGQ